MSKKVAIIGTGINKNLVESLLRCSPIADTENKPLILVCRETVNNQFDRDRLFTKGSTYKFIEVDNKYSRQNNFIGYFIKDDEGKKRWSTEEFKNKYFIKLG